MQSSKGNIINRPIKQNIRNRNFTYADNEESKVSSSATYKEQKMNEITEHRRVAILGNKTEKLALTQRYKAEANDLIQARKAQDE